MVDDNFNLDDLLNDIDAVERDNNGQINGSNHAAKNTSYHDSIGGSKYIPHPPAQEKPHIQDFSGNPKAKFAVYPHHTATTTVPVSRTFTHTHNGASPSTAQYSARGGGGTKPAAEDENSLDNLLNLLSSPRLDQPEQLRKQQQQDLQTYRGLPPSVKSGFTQSTNSNSNGYINGDGASNQANFGNNSQSGGSFTTAFGFTLPVNNNFQYQQQQAGVGSAAHTGVAPFSPFGSSASQTSPAAAGTFSPCFSPEKFMSDANNMYSSFGMSTKLAFGEDSATQMETNGASLDKSGQSQPNSEVKSEQSDTKRASRGPTHSDSVLNWDDEDFDAESAPNSRPSTAQSNKNGTPSRSVGNSKPKTTGDRTYSHTNSKKNGSTALSPPAPAPASPSSLASRINSFSHNSSSANGSGGGRIDNSQSGSQNNSQYRENSNSSSSNSSNNNKNNKNGHTSKPKKKKATKLYKAVQPASSGRNRCSQVVVGGAGLSRGIKSSAFSKHVACDHLRCLNCNFNVLCFLHTRWEEEGTDYMFMRNNVPREDKLSVQLVDDTESAAYCCQCSWSCETDERSLKEGSNNNLGTNSANASASGGTGGMGSDSKSGLGGNRVGSSGGEMQWTCAGH